MGLRTEALTERLPVAEKTTRPPRVRRGSLVTVALGGLRHHCRRVWLEWGLVAGVDQAERRDLARHCHGRRLFRPDRCAGHGAGRPVRVHAVPVHPRRQRPRRTARERVPPLWPPLLVPVGAHLKAGAGVKCHAAGHHRAARRRSTSRLRRNAPLPLHGRQEGRPDNRSRGGGTWFVVSAPASPLAAAPATSTTAAPTSGATPSGAAAGTSGSGAAPPAVSPSVAPPATSATTIAPPSTSPPATSPPHARSPPTRHRRPTTAPREEADTATDATDVQVQERPGGTHHDGQPVWPSGSPRRAGPAGIVPSPSPWPLVRLRSSGSASPPCSGREESGAVSPPGGPCCWPRPSSSRWPWWWCWRGAGRPKPGGSRRAATSRTERSSSSMSLPSSPS